MKYRKLRIAWSVAWGVVAVLFVVLWVRSYWRLEWITFCCGSHSFAASSLTGAINFSLQHREAAGRENRLGSRPIPVEDMARYSALTFLWNTDRNLEVLVVPHWFLATFPVLLAVLSPPRFSLRTLLIATTLVAVVLGLIIYATRG